eukprot:gb/GECG01006266.1/.p1 GENE.gb/GECG01006266.1/~~gb/GECG01006266.1/.p1  ORF type:complete len:378 (+),score=29.20 gb/GECG01006266.1/:1-1134(+)
MVRAYFNQIVTELHSLRVPVPKGSSTIGNIRSIVARKCSFQYLTHSANRRTSMITMKKRRSFSNASLPVAALKSSSTLQGGVNMTAYWVYYLTILLTLWIFPSYVDSIAAEYRFIKWNITERRGGSTELCLEGTGGCLQASMFMLKRSGHFFQVGSNITNPGGSNPPNEDAINLQSSVFTKWLDQNFAASRETRGESIVIFDAGVGASYKFDGYVWYTANDRIERDPASWTLNGRNESEEWTLLHKVENFTATTLRRVSVEEFIINDGLSSPTPTPTTTVSSSATLSDTPSRTLTASPTSSSSSSSTGTSSVTSALSSSTSTPTDSVSLTPTTSETPTISNAVSDNSPSVLPGSPGELRLTPQRVQRSVVIGKPKPM